MTALLHRSRRLLFVLTVALGLTMAFAGSTPASAEHSSPSERARNHYGAIAFSWGDGAGGIANDVRTKAKAKKQAKAICKRRSSFPAQCAVGVWVRNACGALSVRQNGDGTIEGYGWAVRPYKGPAIRAAHAKCTKRFGKKCKKYAWVCTTRHF